MQLASVLLTTGAVGGHTKILLQPFQFQHFGIDPTFNLGEFNITPMVYRHLLLHDEKSGHSPLLLGPLLVHQQKLFRSYNYFLSTLVGLKPDISTVKAIGTDGEKNLVDATVRNFPEAAHVRCYDRILRPTFVNTNFLLQ